MTGKTKIEWTDKSWNPVVGCSVVSPGCTNCYAMRFAGARLQHTPGGRHYVGLTRKSKAGPVWTGKLALAPEKTLLAPLRWKQPAMIFVNSMGDLFHEDCPDEWIDRVFAVMALCPQHTFQVLTKRADRMRDYCTDPERMFNIAGHSQEWPAFQDAIQHIPIFERTISGRCFPNVWLGVSAEDQARADERIPDLLQTPAAMRFVSAEPLLGPINLQRISLGSSEATFHGHPEIKRAAFFMDATRGVNKGAIPALDWIIVGGESGCDARPMHPDWARSIRDQCAAASVPFFFKQWGEWLPWEPEHGPCWIAQNGQSEDHHVLFPADLDSDPDWDDGLWAVNDGCDHFAFQRVGKKAAGRLLDNATHDGMPGGAELS